MEISDELQLSMNKAFQLAAISRHEFVTPEHLLLAFFEYDTIRDLFETLSIPVIPFIHEIETFLNESVPTVGENETPLESVGFRDLLTETLKNAGYEEGGMAGVSDVLMAMLSQKESYAGYFLRSRGVTEKKLAETFRFLEWEASEHLRNLPYDHDDDDDGDWGQEKDDELLERLTVDLTAAAAARKLPPFAGRDDLLEAVQLVLMRRQKRNPLLIGDPGVGKTALAEGLAGLIVAKKVPPFLQGRRILSLDVGALVAGTKYRGEFEMRMHRLLSILEKDDSIILFIDEIHMLVGAGAGEANRMDAAGMLKTGLSGTYLQCIGATTYEEYKKRLEPEKAFIRRFQTIEVPEPSPDETVAIVTKVKTALESHHGITIPAKTVKRAVELSGRYLKERRQPDKSIDLLDEVCADAAFRAYRGTVPGRAVITDEDLVRIVAKMAGLPPEKLTESEEDRLKNLETVLKEAVFGQDAGNRPDSIRYERISGKSFRGPFYRGASRVCRLPGGRCADRCGAQAAVCGAAFGRNRKGPSRYFQCSFAGDGLCGTDRLAGTKSRFRSYYSDYDRQCGGFRLGARFNRFRGRLRRKGVAGFKRNFHTGVS